MTEAYTLLSSQLKTDICNCVRCDCMDSIIIIVIDI